MENNMPLFKQGISKETYVANATKDISLETMKNRLFWAGYALAFIHNAPDHIIVFEYESLPNVMKQSIL